MAKQNWPRIPTELMRYTTVGIEFMSIFAVFLLLGIWMDRRLNTRVVFTLIGAVVGFAAAIYRMVRTVREYGRRSSDSSLDKRGK